MRRLKLRDGTVVLIVVGLDEDFVADVAREVVRMPHLAEGSDGATLARLTALGALLEQEDLIVRSAIEITLELNERDVSTMIELQYRINRAHLVAVTTLELDTTLLATEVTRMHELALDEQVGT